MKATSGLSFTLFAATLVVGFAPRAHAAAKVIVIGIDAASFNVLVPYIAAGVTPNLGKLRAAGASGDLASFWPLRTPQVWTSIATGKLPGQHGLWDNVSHSAFNPPSFRTKEQRLLTSRERKSQALWQMLGAKGIRSLTAGWISSWPAENTPNSTMVAPYVALNDKRGITIKGSFWRDAPKQVAPEALWPTVQKLIVEPNDITDAELTGFANVPPPSSALYALPMIKRYVYALRWSLARAKTVEATTLALLPSVEPAAVYTYFECADTLLHRFWVFQRGATAVEAALTARGLPAKHAPELTQRFGKVMEGCYRDIDERIGRILAAARGPDTLVIVLSDHGSEDLPGNEHIAEEPFGGRHRDAGMIIAAGPGIAAGSKADGCSVLDVAPTVLYAFGLPVGSDMRGKVCAGLFAGDALKAKPVESIPSYEATPQSEVPYADGWPKRKAADTTTSD